MQRRVAAMLALQDQVNTQVHPQWRTQGYPWYRAIWVECAELLDHHGWKWWKHQVPDPEQVRLELVDIWHFGLSALLVQETPPARISGVLETLAELQPAGVDAEAFREAVEQFAGNTLIRRDFDLSGFVRLLAIAGLDFDSLYRGYMGKNVLNRFRQDRGYQQGGYRKHWRGREDNEWLALLGAELDPESPDFAIRLYAALGQCYELGG